MYYTHEVVLSTIIESRCKVDLLMHTVTEIINKNLKIELIHGCLLTFAF